MKTPFWILPKGFACEGKQSQVSCPFDFLGQLALVFCTGAGLAPGADLTVIAHKTAEGLDVFIIDLHFWVCAKAALSFPLITLVVESSVCHLLLLNKDMSSILVLEGIFILWWGLPGLIRVAFIC